VQKNLKAAVVRSAVHKESSVTSNRKLVAEAVGTMLLLSAIVGSGIMGERLSEGNVAIALFANSLATGAMLVAIILVFGPISGAHFNPVVSLALAFKGEMRWRDTAAYVTVQILGALGGLAAAHIMFSEPLFSPSQHVRAGTAQVFSEFLATFGLLVVVWGVGQARPQAVPFAVAAYITAGYWFTASTSFANPAVTLARSLTNTFSGIRPIDVPGFIGAQLLGATAATGLFRWLHRSPELKVRAQEDPYKEVVRGK
jgi:glycerol uptake facilitator-like aquaporin